MAPSIKHTIVVLLLLLGFLAALWTLATLLQQRDFFQKGWEPPRKKNAVANNWALLVAGSRSWENYRHQSDVAHAYHLLRQNGLPEKNIVTMMFDDVANDSQNPQPGTLYNDLSGRNYYKELVVDYRGNEVNAGNFLRVLEGRGDGKVIHSGPGDNVFLYYADHGGVGVLGMPVGSLRKKRTNGYRKLVVYLESCEGGSMFEDFPPGLNVYAITAADPYESSYAVLCSDWLPCVADEFSLSWMRDSEMNGIFDRSLSEQFSNAKRNTLESHVSEYGACDIRNDEIADFQGCSKGPRKPWKRPSNSIPSSAKGYKRLRIQDIPLELARGNRTRRREIEEKREKVIETIRGIVGSVVEKTEAKEAVDFFVRKRRRHSQHSCTSRSIRRFDEKCARFSENPFAFKYSFVIANLCEWTREESPIVESIDAVCENLSFDGVV
ncbi:hypothetical protein QR680_005673 [Steinernema hermaphroditum]|uniref:Legumain prodomain domain-containing protein n=1 Tax=Steinernema hermaphroditum TaxID=289476 RepID=A0AA39HU96_9BILA|nr:hypothetical protein QR680_005673 [Steinernema hermaphroditum]